MIKVNLAYTTTSSGSFTSPSSFVGGEILTQSSIRSEGLKRLVLLLVGPILLYIYEGYDITEKNARLNLQTAALAELQEYNSQQAASVAEIKKFKEDEAEIEERIAAVEKISLDRQREVKILDLIQTITPEKSWVTKIDLGKQKMTIEGMAVSDFEVSAFLEALTRSVLLLEVNLVNSTEVSLDGVNYKRFEIVSLVERPVVGATNE